MRSVQVVEAKSNISALLVAVESGETIAIMRRVRVVARLVPDVPRCAADAFRHLWLQGEDIDMVAPTDSPPESVETL